MSDEVTSRVVIVAPLWKVLEYGKDYLQHEVERAAYEMGLGTIRHPATSFGAIMAELRIEVSQNWTRDE